MWRRSSCRFAATFYLRPSLGTMQEMRWSQGHVCTWSLGLLPRSRFFQTQEDKEGVARAQGCEVRGMSLLDSSSSAGGCQWRRQAACLHSPICHQLILLVFFCTFIYFLYVWDAWDNLHRNNKLRTMYVFFSARSIHTRMYKQREDVSCFCRSAAETDG